VYNKPLIYYSLSLLMLAGIREILVVGPPEDESALRRLLGGGEHLGLRIDYAFERMSDRSARVLVTAAEFMGSEGVAVVRCDSILCGHGLVEPLQQARGRRSGATLFTYRVSNAERYGVVEFDGTGRAIRVEENSVRSTSPWAITNLLFFDGRVLDVIAQLKPAAPDLKLTDVSAAYMEAGRLHVEKLGRGIAWLDAETHATLLQASAVVQMAEERQGLMVACVEEIAYAMGYIGAEDVRRLAAPMQKNTYGQYLLRLVDGGT
jgi:glucose-1-phosphate thymidylyltransferase